MLGKGRGRACGRFGLAMATLLAGMVGVASAQQTRGTKPGKATVNVPKTPAPGANDGEPRLQTVVVPTNPGEAVAKINGETITYQQLADECIVRKGEEILETMIARKLIDQAIKAKNLTITPTEIDEEIERVAQQMAGISRENWLRTLHKERGISPVQYARDIIYPALALRKLAEPGVVVTDAEYQEAFATSYGEKLRCRIILVNKARDGRDIWETLKKDPERFERIARDDNRSVDQGTKSLGGLLGEPLRRHAMPRVVSDAAFHDLVDGDPKDKDPKHKPKDGDISGLIQVSETTWVIIKRESLDPGEAQDPQHPVDPKDPAVRKRVTEVVHEAKLKDEMAKIYNEMTHKAAIENKLVGQQQEANEDKLPESRIDGQVKLTSDPDAALPKADAAKTSDRVNHPPAPRLAPAGAPPTLKTTTAKP